MSLKNIKSSHQATNTQFVIFNSNGVVLESDNVLFSIQQKSKLATIHPFFENIVDVVTPEGISFSCVHLNIAEKSLTCDVEIKPIENDTYLLILIDFSKHYESFQSLAQSRNENAIKSEILTVKNEILKEKETFKNKFISNFSHEIISPITSIIAFTNLIKDSKLTEKQKDYIEVIDASSLHLKSMINDVLDISKLETSKLEVHNELFNLKKLITQIESEYTYKCAKKQLDFYVNIDETLPTYIESDKTKIRQLIKNLLNNALKFTKTGYISFSVQNVFMRAKRISLAFTVEDTGSGIKEEKQQEIFNRFSRLENAKLIEGVGLGLSIVKEITELLGATIKLKSKPKKGSQFTINLKATYPVNQEAKSPKKTQKKFQKNKQKHQILIAEDNELHQLTMFKLLAKTNNFYLDIVSNGVEAIEAVKKASYDIILMDYKMPLMDGLEAAKVIRNLEHKQKRNIPIIITTGAHVDTELLSQQGKDINHIIPKPFDEELFIQTIENCLIQ